MSISRRAFLRNTGITTTVLMTLNGWGSEFPLTRFRDAYDPNFNLQDTSYFKYADSLTLAFSGQFAIHQGLTFEDLTYVNILRPIKAEISYEVVDSKNRVQKILITRESSMMGSDLQMDQIKIFDLSLAEVYRLRIKDNKNQVIDERAFTTLNTQKQSPKIVVGSCMNDFFKTASTTMWNSMQAKHPDIIFLIGDTCYSDNGNDGSKLGYWKRYCETRQQISIFRQRELTPIMATWDDHDFGGNNADYSFGLKAFTLDLFSIFWLFPQHRHYQRGVGVSQFYKVFGQKFHLMDDRFYRDANTQWGSVQEEALYQNIQTDKTPSWIMNGSQFFGGYLKKDAYEYKQNAHLKQICNRLSKLDSSVVFVSGDVHFSEIMNIESKILGYPTYEITSSSIHSFTFFGNHDRQKNPRRIVAHSKQNYTVIQIDNRISQKVKFSVTSYNQDKTLYTQQLQVNR